MIDYRFQVFLAVASRGSFTQAAETLHISQPAVSRHIRELENSLGCRLIDRKGSGIFLTDAGKVLVRYGNNFRALSRDLMHELSLCSGRFQGVLRIGASTTVAQYVLPNVLSAFRKRYPDVSLEATTSNSEEISALLRAGTIDLGLVEGLPHSRDFDYYAFSRDEIVLAAGTHSGLPDTLESADALKKLSFAVREYGSGTQEFIQEHLSRAGISAEDLQIDITLDSTEAIKRYLREGQCVAFVSVAALRDDLHSGFLKIIDIKDFEIARPFHLICLKGEQSRIVNAFRDFLLYNFSV